MAETQVRSPYFTDQYTDNQVIRDLLKGLRGVRSSGVVTGSNQAGVRAVSAYLPQFDQEPNHIYTQRVQRSYLTNYFLRTIQSDSGKILAAPLGVADSSGQDLPEEYSDWLENVDLEGMSIDVLASDQLKAAQAKGLAMCYVDYTDGERPFVHQIDIDNVLSFRADHRTGRLTFLRWTAALIDDSDEDGLLIDNCNVIFEITPTEWRIFDEGNSEPRDQGEIVRFRNGRERITDEIPVSLFYTNKRGQLLADSPYRALAELTIEHFQVSSDIKNMMFYALQPLLFASGVPEEFTISALASYVMAKVGEGADNADLKWVQVDSGPIEQAREQVADIESRISAFGIDANSIRATGNQTATARAIDSAGSNAALKIFATGLQEHIERIIDMMSSYTLNPVESQVTISPDFSLSDNTEKSAVLVNAFEKRLISGKAATDGLIQNNVLDKDFDYELDQQIIRENDEISGML